VNYATAPDGWSVEDWLVQSIAIVPDPTPVVENGTMSFAPVSDATIRKDTPTINYGSDHRLSVDAKPLEEFLLKFSVSGVGSKKVKSTKLQLYGKDASNKGGVVYFASSNNWSENSVTWNSAPTKKGSALNSFGAAVINQANEVDLTAFIKSDGEYTLRVVPVVAEGAQYASKEDTGGNGPKLRIEIEEASQVPIPSVIDITPPSTPTSVSVTTNSVSSLTVVWAASSDNVSVSEYRVYRCAETNCIPTSQVGTESNTTFVDTGLQPNTTYTYRIQAQDSAGLLSGYSIAKNAKTAALITALENLAFSATDDTYVRSDSIASIKGSDTILNIDGSPERDVLIKFTVTGVQARTVTSAKIRLYVGSDNSDAGGNFYKVSDTSWSEGSVSWSNAPTYASSPFGSIGATLPNMWYEVDASSFITSDGVYSVRIKTPNSNGSSYYSKEASSNHPELVLTVQ
jgi:chitodextrinase